MRVEVMNVTIGVEEQVASIITDNCQLCWEILWEHFGFPSPVLPLTVLLVSCLLLYCLMVANPAFLEKLFKVHLHGT